MKKLDFYRFIEQGTIEGACRYFEYWYIYSKLPKKGNVLEIGAGKSALPLALKEKGLSVTVTDISESAVLYQAKQGLEAVQVKDCKLPFENNSFDVVISASAIEHFENDVEMVNEVHRVLKPNGLFILALPASTETITNRYAGSNHPPEKVYSEKEYKKVFLKNFTEEDRQMYVITDEQPTDFVPHAGWKTRRNFKKIKKFSKDIGLCVTLKNQLSA